MCGSPRHLMGTPLSLLWGQHLTEGSGVWTHFWEAGTPTP